MGFDARYRVFLDDISACFLNNDFAAWEAVTMRPFTMITKQGPLYLATRDALRVNFEHYVEACKITQIDTIYRAPVSIEDAGDSTLIAAYETQLLHKGQRVTPPFLSSALIHVVDDDWRMSSIMGARSHHDVTGHHPNSWEL